MPAVEVRCRAIWRLLLVVFIAAYSADATTNIRRRHLPAYRCCSRVPRSCCCSSARARARSQQRARYARASRRHIRAAACAVIRSERFSSLATAPSPARAHAPAPPRPAQKAHNARASARRIDGHQASDSAPRALRHATRGAEYHHSSRRPPPPPAAHMSKAGIVGNMVNSHKHLCHMR